MKSNLLKLYILSFLFLSDFVMFAQPGTGDEDGCLECDDPPPAPINSKLFWLAVFGIAFAFYHFRNRKNKTA